MIYTQMKWYFFQFANCNTLPEGDRHFIPGPGANGAKKTPDSDSFGPDSSLQLRLKKLKMW
jgi:hypothetical protein